MTVDKDLKRLVRARMAKTGESYTSALRHIRARDSADQPRTRPKDGVLNCSFCGRSQHDVIGLIRGPSVYICNECISGIHALEEERATDTLLRIVEQGTKSCSFCSDDTRRSKVLAKMRRGLRLDALLPWRKKKSPDSGRPQVSLQRRGKVESSSRLYEGMGVHICETCVRLCDELIEGRPRGGLVTRSDSL
jgi:hypothetical protein